MSATENRGFSPDSGSSLGGAGASASRMSHTLARAELPALIALSLVFGLVGGILAGVLISPAVGAVVGVVLALLVSIVVRRRAASYRWRLGARGERRTAWRLNRLRRDGWVVFHDLSLPGSSANVDHLVIGEPGIFLVDSKYRRGAVRFGGRDGWIRIGKAGGPLLVRSTQWESKEVSRVLSHGLGHRVNVTALLAVHVPNSRFPSWRKFSASGVRIMSAKAVVPWLRERPRMFSTDDVAAAAAVVRERLPAYRQR
ncbi:hypothetical protein GCM10009603_35990 [Nocardiopsis exhalans]